MFIDESGNPGLSTEHSKYFVLAAILFKNKDECEEFRLALDEFLTKINWGSNDELKFYKTPKNVIEQVLKFSTKFNFSIKALVVDKRNFSCKSIKTTSKGTLPLFFLKEFLSRLNLENARVFVDGCHGKEFTKNARSFLRKNIKNNSKLYVTFRDSKSDRILQLVDLVAGSIYHSYVDNNKYYLKILRKKVINIFEF